MRNACFLDYDNRKWLGIIKNELWNCACSREIDENI